MKISDTSTSGATATSTSSTAADDDEMAIFLSENVLEQIGLMDREQNLRALKKHNNDPDKAMEELMGWTYL